MIIPDFVAAYWKVSSDGDLLIGDRRVSAITAQHGTPLFVYDRNILERKYEDLRHALPRRFSISYSVKANPNPAFLKFFLGKGCGLEIASAGEFYQAMEAGCRTANIVFAGPGKSESELQEVIAARVGEIHVESELEIQRISSISRRLGLRTAVAIRVNPAEDAQGGAMRMGGKPAPFGVDEENLRVLLQRIGEDPWLDFHGIHLFVGTQILDDRVLITQYQKAVQIGRQVAAQLGTPLRTLDFGGGLGIPYFDGDSELDLSHFAESLGVLMAEIEDDRAFIGTNFMVEPGRFLVGESGVYITRINDIKISRGKKYLVLDGGMNHHLAASGNLGQVIKRNFPIALLNRMHESQSEVFDVVGPLCTPLDVLGRSVQLPDARVGDLIGIFQSGAYARTASPLWFLGHPTPPEVWVENGRDFLIRRRGSVQDYMRDVVPVCVEAESVSCADE